MLSSFQQAVCQRCDTSRADVADPCMKASIFKNYNMVSNNCCHSQECLSSPCLSPVPPSTTHPHTQAVLCLASHVLRHAVEVEPGVMEIKVGGLGWGGDVLKFRHTKAWPGMYMHTVAASLAP